MPVGFLVGVVVFGNDQDWQQPTAMTTVAGVLVGIMLEAVQPKTVRGTALIVTRLVRALYKGGAGSVGGATLLVIPVLVSFGSGVPWVSVAPPAGGILGGVSAVIASFIVSLIAATVMLAIALIAGALLGALLGGIIGITLEFSTPHVSSKMGSAAALTDAGRGLH